METTPLSGLISNAALLLALGLVYDTLAQRTGKLRPKLQRIATGVVLGAMGIALIANHVVLRPGLIFDTRSVLLSLAGLFFGTLPTLVAVAMTAAYRLYLGGNGVGMGLGVIVSSAAIGLAWRHLRLKKLESLGLGELYLMGLVVHLALLACMLALPAPLIRQSLLRMGLPVMLIYPVGEALLGLLLAGRDLRQRAGVELRKSEARYRLLFEEMMTGFSVHQILCDAAGKPVDYRFLAVNAEFERLTGLKGGEIVGRTVREVLPGIEADWIERFGRVALGGEPIRFEHYAAPFKKYFEVRAYCPEPGKFAVISLDVTRRKREENLNRLNEERLSSLLRISEFQAASLQELLDYALREAVKLTGSQFGTIYHYDEDTRRFTVNSWSHEVMAGGNVAEIPTVCELEKTGVWGEAVRQRQAIVMNDFQAPEPLGKGYPAGHLELHKYLAIPLIEENRIVAVVGVANKAEDYDEADVRQLSLLMHGVWQMVEKRRSEEALRESEARFRELVEHAPVPIFIQTEMNFAYLNGAAVEALGASSPADLLGKSVLERFHPDHRETVAGRITILNDERREVPTIEEVFLKMDGTAIQTEVSAVPFFYHGRHGALVFFRDITDRKRAEMQRLQIEHQIQQAQKLESLGVLAGGIAHDFNNILMAILGHADLAQLELAPMSPARRSLQEITKASRRAADLCRQMLAYSGRGKFVIETIVLGDLIDEMVHLLQTTITKKALLNLHLEKNLPPIRGDATQIRQILMNLVINASEAIGERSGVITISTGAMACTRDYLAGTYLDEELDEGLYVWLQVSDTGCGMDKETQRRLFEPFFTTKFTGRGLGMAAVMGIVRGHKGALKVYSEPGKGTTFKVLFPAAIGEPAANGGKAEDAGLDWKGAGTILLVDDEETIRTLGKLMLEKLGFEVLIAEDGRQACEIYIREKDRIDMVLLDMTMPHMNGEEAFRELRRMNPAVKVVISSGYTESEIISRFAGKGASGFVQKPYTLAALRERLRDVSGEGTQSGG